MKKFISVAMALLMSLTIMNVSAFAQKTITRPESWKIELPKWKIAASNATGLTAGLPYAAVDPATYSAAYDTSSWIPADVPGTLEGNLVDAGIYDSKFKQSPDGSYDIYYDDNFSKVPLADFANPWWYSVDFDLLAEQSPETGKKVCLTFKGISYTGRVFVNGTELSNKNITILSDNELKNRSGSAPNWTYTDVTTTISAANSSVGGPGFGVNDFDNYKNLFKGAFRTYELDVSDVVHTGKNNIKVLVTRPMYKMDTADTATSGDFASFWVDWHPTPADMNGGLTGDAFVTISGDVRLSNPLATAVVADDLKSADVKFYVDVNNMTSAPISGILKAMVAAPDGTTIAAELPDTPVTVAANAYCQEVSLATWTVSNPELWWPYLSGDQPLYIVKYEFIINGRSEPSDLMKHRFGIRQIEQKVTTSTLSSSSNQPQFQIYVNHQPIVLKGGGYCPTDLLLRHSELNNRAAIDLVKSMGMNVIRDEGKFFDDNLLDLMDENGILNMTGWCCCDRHQNPNAWTKAERWVSFESLYSQMRSNRAHASAALWFNGSDSPPDRTDVAGQNVGARYLEIEGRMHWFEQAAIACSANSTASNLSGGRSGFHMDASYDSQSPSLCYTSSSQASLGFISEGHGGAGVPYVESLRRFIPETNLWPINKGSNYNVWNYHSARASFANIDQQVVFVDSVYGGSDTIDIANARTQLFQYEIQRASYEALNFYRFNQSTGLINWMLNDARPGIMWNQFDYYMNPFGSTFGAGKANEAVHIMYNPAMIANYNPAQQEVAPGANGISIINNTPKDMGLMTATATIYDINGNIINKPLVKTVNVKPDGITGYSGTATNRTVGYIPNGDWITGGFKNFQVAYAQVATGSTGLTVLWTNNDINNSLIKPTSDVYFLRLELADKDGKVVSYNNYAVPRRKDVNGTSSSWARAAEAQTMDLTQLNSLPPIDMVSGLVMTQIASKKVGDTITQTFQIKNNTGTVAYGVDLKAYKDSSCKDLVSPSLYSDNLMIIFPGQTREITVAHYASVLDRDSVVTINCYNNIISDKPRLGNVYDPLFNRAGTPTTTSATTNLARAKAVTGTNNSNSTAIASVALANAAMTVIDSNISSVSTISTTNANATGFSIDLGAVGTKFDKLMIRWSAAASTGGTTNMLSGVPSTVRIQTSDNNSSWTTISTIDNSRAESAMTEITFPTTVTARYIRIQAEGTVGNSAAYGTVPNTPSGAFRHEAPARNASANFNVCAFEVYSFRTSVYLDFIGKGTIVANGTSYNDGMTALQRSITPDASGNLTLQFTSDTPEKPMGIFRDGVNITSQLDQNNSITLTGITADTEIRAAFSRFAANRSNVVPGDVVTATVFLGETDPASKVLAALYKDGKLEYVYSAVNVAAGLTEVPFTIPSDASGKTLKLFLWSGSDYIPLEKEITIG